MNFVISSILGKINKNNKKLNILTFNKNQEFTNFLCLLNHNFIIAAHPSYPKWDVCKNKMPNNLVEIQNMNTFIRTSNIDLVVSQDRFIDALNCIEISSRLNCPVVSIEFERGRNDKDNQFKTEALADLFFNHKIFIGNEVCISWGHSVSDDLTTVLEPNFDDKFLSDINKIFIESSEQIPCIFMEN